MNGEKKHGEYIFLIIVELEKKVLFVYSFCSKKFIIKKKNDFMISYLILIKKKIDLNILRSQM